MKDIQYVSSHREKQMTPEQQHILNHNIERDHVVKIMAFAGKGLTPDFSLHVHIHS